MKKIYVVTSGCYSDYTIEKIFSKREDAEKYCALQNTQNGWSSNDLSEEHIRDLSWEYEYRVEEHPIDDVDVLSTTASLKRKYIYTLHYGEEYFHSYGEVYTEKNHIKISEYSEQEIKAAAIFDSDWPREKVQKIMRDEIARYKAGKHFLV